MSTYLSFCDLVPQVIPQVPQFGEGLLDHVLVRVVGHFLQQQLPLVAELFHVDLLLVHLHLELLLKERVSESVGHVPPEQNGVPSNHNANAAFQITYRGTVRTAVFKKQNKKNMDFWSEFRSPLTNKY